MSEKNRSLFRFWTSSGKEQEAEKLRFEEALATLLGYLAVCDSPLKESEREGFRKLLSGAKPFRFAESTSPILEAFDKASQSYSPLPTKLVFEFYWSNRLEKERLWLALEAMVRLAVCDGPINSLETEFLETVVRGFGLSSKEFYLLRDRVLGTTNGKTSQRSSPPPRRFAPQTMDRAEALKILGCNNSATLQEIKRAYRSKAKECHYDKIVHKLRSPESLSDASEKFLLIQRAYELLRDS
jgi:DnaJ-domain-containing protein 1